MLDRLNQPISFKLPTRLPSLGSAPSLRRTKAPKRDLVGLDIEPGQIVAAQVRANGRVEVTAAAGVPVAVEAVRDGEIADVETLTSALRDLFAAHKLDRRVRIGVANQRVVVRMVELPPIADARELATAVRFQAQDEIPMPIDSAVLDFHSLGVVETAAGPRQQVVLVAARRDMVERVLQAARGAGLRPEGVDLAAFAMIRALRPAGAPADERAVYLAIGGLTNLAIAQGSVCHFTRVLGGGTEQIISEVAARCAITVSEARALIARAGTVAPVAAPDPDDDDEEATPRPSATPESVARSVLLDSIRRIAAEVRNSIDFHRAQPGGYAVSRAVVCGPATDIPGFVEALESELGLPVGAGKVSYGVAGDGHAVPVSRLTVAAGLALERGLS